MLLVESLTATRKMGMTRDKRTDLAHICQSIRISDWIGLLKRSMAVSSSK